MTFIAVRCPYCHSDQIVKRGKTRRGTQRYLCHNTACPPQSFLLEYCYQGRLPEVQQQIIDMSLNASGIRDTARVLRISTDTVLRALRKKEAALASVNSALLRTIDPAEILVDIEQAGEAEVDEMWSFVGKKGNQRWLWHAIDHHTGQVLASVFGRRKDAVFLQLKALLERLVPDAVPDDALMSPYKALATAVVTQALPDLARQAAEDLDAALEALQKLTAQEPWDIMAGRVGDGARDAHCGPGTATQTWRSGSGFLFDMNPTLMESEVLTELIIVSPARAPLPLSSAGWAVTPMTCP